MTNFFSHKMTSADWALAIIGAIIAGAVMSSGGTLFAIAFGIAWVSFIRFCAQLKGRWDYNETD